MRLKIYSKIAKFESDTSLMGEDNINYCFVIRIYFIRISRLTSAKFQEYFKNKPQAEILKRMLRKVAKSYRCLYGGGGGGKFVPPTIQTSVKCRDFEELYIH